MVCTVSKQKPNCTKEQLITLLKNEGLYDADVEKALLQAAYSHRFHCRDDGKPYTEQHVFPLTIDAYNYFKHTSNARLAVIATLLHDVPEKDPVYTEKRLVADFGEVVASHVKYLLKPVKMTSVRTHADRHDEQVEFMKIIESAPDLCKIIKVMDRINNLSCTDAYRNIAKYKRFVQDSIDLYLPLAKSLDETLAVQLEQEIARLSQELNT